MSQPRKSFRTPQGTELPLLNLRGREYLQIMHRLVWMREQYPTATVKTQMINNGGEGKDQFYIFRAEIYVPIEGNPQPQLVATGHKRETVGDFPDAMEKAEMGAIGRALGVLGFGTQFAADDLEEGSRLADSPAPVVESATATVEVSTAAAAGKRTSFRSKKTETTLANGSDL